MLKAHVIFCNDNPEGVVISKEVLPSRAIDILEKLRYDDFNKHFAVCSSKEDFEKYRARNYWHIHVVDLM